MALEVKRKEKESSQNLVHRFTKTVRQSGILLEVRGKQFRKRPKSTLAKKRSAVRRVILRAEKKQREKLEKPKAKISGRY
jgi:ribosomal protein S21